MKVLTFGWDFPPQTTGGLGIACQGLTREIAQEGVEVIFVLPKSQIVAGTQRFIFADSSKSIKIHEVFSSLVPYGTERTMVDVFDRITGRRLYSRKLMEEVREYANKAAKIAEEEDFDLIHAHDWTAYLAGVAAKVVSGKKLIIHVHATTFDQAASDNIDPEIFNIELEGFSQADQIIAVSHYTKKMLVEKHKVPAGKISVVHNGCDTEDPPCYEPTLQNLKQQGKKIVLYHGRITVQKGVDYFVRAARIVVDHDPNVVFVISGKGDMEAQIMQQVASQGLSDHVIFAGALWYEERDRMYQSADLVVMPSVSEPFGLVPLEALQNGSPSLISKQSGVAEVISHVLKVDFWDVEEMANKILATLRYPVMQQQLVNEGKRELQKLSWREAARKVLQVYERVMQFMHQEVC
ncbi:glycosyltransferase family 4 protein [Candidatus Kaiserbacteria bacterium]|nr:glycosyltransferase family 4 protein [Candidatus Kaiserbacteria bacterium]